MNLNFIIRSPHISEVLVAYGGVHVISLYLMIFYYRATFYDILLGYLCGSVFYSFIEYWFHRVILHRWIFYQAHKFHHDNPIKLSIIATPLLVVQIYETFMMVLLSAIFGSYIAVFIQVGVSISQVIMDFVHLYEHSSYNPYILKVARNYHKLHHQKSNWEMGHGLTTRFWDVVFRTFPENWNVYKRHPIVKYLTVPIPLVDFLLISPFLDHSNDNQSDPMLLKIQWSNYRKDKIMIAMISSIIVGFSPFLLDFLY
jgi:sterol desaturase/sphingolipid hydroxylase (fatty acid hydroxylase superfamily)